MIVSHQFKPIGVGVDSGEFVCWENTKQGVTVITGLPSTGKTTNAKNIAVMSQKSSLCLNGRKVIYIDVYGDWGFTYPQSVAWDSLSVGFDCEVIVNPVFPFEVHDVEDFQTLGFTPGASKILCRLAGYLNHFYKGGFSLDLVDSMVQNIPLRDEEVAVFNSRFAVNSNSFVFRHKQNEKAVSSLKNFWEVKKSYFYSVGEFYDYKFLLSKSNIYIMFGGDDSSNLRCRFGLILKVLNSVIDLYHPLIIVDEADKFCPNVGGLEVFYPSSNRLLYEYLFKVQRLGVHVVFICQYLDQIDQSFVPGIKCRISGGQTDKKYIDIPLKMDHERGVREFAIKKLHGSWVKFVPIKPLFEIRNTRSWGVGDYDI